MPYLHLICMDLLSVTIKMLCFELPLFCHQIPNAYALEVKDSSNNFPAASLQQHFEDCSMSANSEQKTRKLLLNIAKKYGIRR